MSKNIFINNLSNKNPTKDITQDDIKYKIPEITKKQNITVKVNNRVFQKKTCQLLQDRMVLKVEN